MRVQVMQSLVTVVRGRSQFEQPPKRFGTPPSFEGNPASFEIGEDLIPIPFRVGAGNPRRDGANRDADRPQQASGGLLVVVHLRDRDDQLFPGLWFKLDVAGSAE